MGFGNRANRGKAWEQHLEAWHHIYAREGTGEIVPTQAPTKRVKGGGFVSAGVGPVDFLGVALGVPVAFDAKKAKGDRWGFDHLVRHPRKKPGSRVAPMAQIHQPLMLDRWAKAQGCAFIALRLGERAYVVPWEDLGPLFWVWWHAKKRGQRAQASIDQTWCDENAWAIPMRSGWLGYVEVWKQRRQAARLFEEGGC